MVHHNTPHRPWSSPPACPPHTLIYALKISFILPIAWAISQLRSQEVNARARILLRIVSTVTPRLDFTIQPLFGQPRKPRFQRPPAWVMVYDCSINTPRVADPKGAEVRFKGVSDQDGGRSIFWCEDGHELCLDFSHSCRSRREQRFCNA
jgi:hypothetical protein